MMKELKATCRLACVRACFIAFFCLFLRRLVKF